MRGAHLVLSFAAKELYNQRLTTLPKSSLPAFEDYVEQLCAVCGELRKSGEYPQHNSLPCDATLYKWRAEARLSMQK